MIRNTRDGSGSSSTSKSTVDWHAFDQANLQKKFEIFVDFKKKHHNKMTQQTNIELNRMIPAIKGETNVCMVSNQFQLQCLRTHAITTKVRINPALSSAERIKLQHTAIENFRFHVG